MSYLQRLQVALIAAAGWVSVWLIGWTVRFRVEDWGRVEKLRQSQTPTILSFWHNQIFLATFFFRFRGIVVITSRHFDGEYIARIIRKFGYGSARGSSTRGGVRALLELKRHLQAGTDVAFTIDGPRGPVYRVKSGPVWLAAKTGFPIVPFHIEPRRCWTLNSWDQFRIPRPFTEALVKIGQPLVFRSDTNPEEGVETYQQEMDRLRTYCEHYDWGRTT